MRDEITEKGVGASDPEYMMVLGQALRCGIIMLDRLIVSMKRRPPDMQQTTLCTDFLLVLLAKLLAISIGKMNIDILCKDITFCIYHTNPRN